MNVKLITVTPNAEETMGYVAQGEQSNNQDNPVSWFTWLLHKHQHWSVFEQAHMTLEIETTRGIAAQILRHRSFTYQEFSQRYANTNMLGQIDVPDLRSQDHKNRQNSIDDRPSIQKARLQGQIQRYFSEGLDLYTTNSYVGYCEGMCEICSPSSNTDPNIHDRQCSVLDSLYRFKICTWNAKRTHGHCRSM